MENIFKNIGQAVRALRKERQLTLQQLADSIPGNFDAGNLSRFERGEQGISENKLIELCKVLGVSVSGLYAMTEHKGDLRLGLSSVAEGRPGMSVPGPGLSSVAGGRLGMSVPGPGLSSIAGTIPGMSLPEPGPGLESVAGGRLGITSPKPGLGLSSVAGQRQEGKNRHTGKIPLITWSTAGKRTESIKNVFTDVAEDWLPCPPNCAEDSTFALRVTGDSMDDGTAQGYHDGELIFIDKSQNTPEHNADVVVKTESGGVSFKRLIQSEGTWYLKTLNPNWPTKIIEPGPDYLIVGRVMFSSKFRA